MFTEYSWEKQYVVFLFSLLGIRLPDEVNAHSFAELKTTIWEKTVIENMYLHFQCDTRIFVVFSVVFNICSAM